MTRYKDNKYGIEAFEIIDIYIPNINSDDDPQYDLMMTTSLDEVETYCSSAYEKNLENIQVQLEKQFDLERKESGYKQPKVMKSILERNTSYLKRKQKQLGLSDSEMLEWVSKDVY